MLASGDLRYQQFHLSPRLEFSTVKIKFDYNALRRILTVTSVLASVSALSAHAQPGFSFGPPTGSDFQDQAVQNVGISPVAFLGKVWNVYQASSPAGEVCLTGYYLQDDFAATCPDTITTGFPAVDGVPQATVWNGKLYLAFAQRSNHQLVIASSTDGAHFSWTEPSGVFVGVSPAIAVLNNELYVAYQENQSAHYIGVAKSSDGVNFTHQISTVYRIGHAPAMTYFNGQLVIAAFCQCDSHYLDVYTTTGSLSPTFATEDTTKTLANASQPSLAVYNNVLLLGYMQNGQRYFQTSTSNDAIHWSAAVRQTNLTNGWNGLGLAVLGSQIWGVYESQSAISGDPNSAANEFAYSVLSNLVL